MGETGETGPRGFPVSANYLLFPFMAYILIKVLLFLIPAPEGETWTMSHSSASGPPLCSFYKVFTR